MTPLHLAAEHSKSEQLLKLLLANPELVYGSKDKAGDAPIDIARRSGRNDVLFEAVEPCFL